MFSRIDQSSVILVLLFTASARTEAYSSRSCLADWPEAPDGTKDGMKVLPVISFLMAKARQPATSSGRLLLLRSSPAASASVMKLRGEEA